jgi:hypothetical protein
VWRGVLCTRASASWGICFQAVVGCWDGHGLSYYAGALPVLLRILCCSPKMKAHVNVAAPAGQLLRNMSCPAAVCLVPQFFVGAVLSSQDWCCCCLVLLRRPFGCCTSCTPHTDAHTPASPSHTASPLPADWHSHVCGVKIQPLPGLQSCSSRSCAPPTEPGVATCACALLMTV